MRARMALAPVALAAAVAGCGASSFLGSESPTDTVRQFLEAAAAHDGGTACGLLNGHGQQLMSVYPDGAHDVEAIYVSPRDSALYLVSKGRSGGVRLYRVARAQLWRYVLTVPASLSR